MEPGSNISKGNSMTTYKDIVNFPGYRVGDDGSVWSCLKRSGRGAGGEGSGCVPGKTWKQLRPGKQPSGARYVFLRTTTCRLVHHLVLEAFVGPCPEGMECCHNDGDNSNNRLGNLRWDTKRSNESDKSKHGTNNQGERHGMSKFTADIVRAIRADYATGLYSQSELAKKNRCGQMQISRIVTRKQWAHIV